MDQGQDSRLWRAPLERQGTETVFARTPGVPESQASDRKPDERSLAGARAELKLMQRVLAGCNGPILEACATSSLPPEFLGALTANESSGNAKAARFEPAVYRHLRAIADGLTPEWSGVQATDLEAEIEEMLHPKAAEFHGHYFPLSFGADHRQELAAFEDEVLRELATSWGFTQIMGYHLVGRPGTTHDLLEPRFHFSLAVALLAEFAEDYQLDLAQEFEELFRCWNTGRPYGQTFDPSYVENGLRRMKVYRELAAGQVGPKAH